jgi:hypothetical protein
MESTFGCNHRVRKKIKYGNRYSYLRISIPPFQELGILQEHIEVEGEDDTLLYSP